MEEHSALQAEDDKTKKWLIDSGCTAHLCPNWSNFVLYTPYDVPHQIKLGNGTYEPSLGEGVISLNCIVNGNQVSCHFRNVQYIPGLTHGLLSHGVLDDHGLYVQGGDGMIKFTHCNSTVVIECLKKNGQLYHLNVASNLPPDTTAAIATTPSFDLLHKRLTYPGKDALQLMICKDLASGLSGVTDDAKDFDCIACIQGKMTQGPFQVGHQVADK